MAGFEIEGLDEAIEELEKLERRAEALDGEHEVAFPDLFPPKFMRRYTDFASIEAMLEASPWEVEGNDDFAAIPEAEWEEYVANNTRFATWEAMQEKATTEWSARQLGLS